MRSRDKTERDLWLLSDRGIAIAVGATMALGLTALWWMWRVAGHAPTAAQRSTLSIEAIKYGIGSIAAAGGLAALLLSVRRQKLAERTQQYTERDSGERRVTDLYTKAVELLGSTDAAVRLGGLYALDRLAQDNVAQRQPIVNVICALLRMPFVLPDAVDDPPAPADVAPDPHEQLQVRITAQRILIRHLCVAPGVGGSGMTASPDNPFWPDIDLDLTGASLVDWEFDHGRLRRATFVRTSFAGLTGFAGLVVTEAASFDSAAFEEAVEFGQAAFAGPVRFVGTRFHKDVSFSIAEFAGTADFGNAAFAGDADFDSTRFRRAASFETAQFFSRALFRAARFAGVARFRETVFHRWATFREVPFADTAVFSDAGFRSDVDFVGAMFGGDAWFAQTRFSTSPDFTAARHANRAHTIDWPPGWREDDATGELLATL